MQRLVETCEQHLRSVQIVLVASDKPCAGIDFAAAHGLPILSYEIEGGDSAYLAPTALGANALSYVFSFTDPTVPYLFRVRARKVVWREAYT